MAQSSQCWPPKPWIQLDVIRTRISFITFTLVFILPSLGREFMPELEEGNLYIRGTFAINSSLDEVQSKVNTLRAIFRKYPEVEAIVPQVGRPEVEEPVAVSRT